MAGALFLQRAQHVVPVYAAAKDLPSGTELASGDLAVVRVRLGGAQLDRYLRPADGPVVGQVLTRPVAKDMLIPAGALQESMQSADMVEISIKTDEGDMVQGLAPGDAVQVLAAFDQGQTAGTATVLLESAEVTQVFEESGGLGGGDLATAVQVRMPSGKAKDVAAALANGRIFVIRAPALPSAPPAPPPPTNAAPTTTTTPSTTP